MTVNNRRNFLHKFASVAGMTGSISAATPWMGAGAYALLPSPAHAFGGDDQKGIAEGQSQILAKFASELRFEDIPNEVIANAKNSIIDSIATQIYGSQLPWSKIITQYALANECGGKSRVMGINRSTSANFAALCNGAFAHAFELDNLTKPNSGCHPGATVLTASLATAQNLSKKVSGKDLLTAYIAGTEMMIRVGRATQHSQEVHGFHAPGTTGPFGGAVGSAHIRGLNTQQTQMAIGIAASTSGGLLEFAKIGNGSMVKRLHLGRAAESGVMAASLASQGFTGPTTGLEGDFGFIKVFCRSYDLNQLTVGLGDTWLTNTIMIKRYACHITAHTPIEASLKMKAEYHIQGEDIESIDIQTTDRAVRVNNIPKPKDILIGQYSIPFCVALSFYKDPVDPRSFSEQATHDTNIMQLAQRVNMRPLLPPGNQSDMTSIVSIRLKDGRTFSEEVSAFKGTPEHPITNAELRQKFEMLTNDQSNFKTEDVFQRLLNLENEKSINWIGA
jgi:2-methylcitrate dehydratase PrpD